MCVWRKKQQHQTNARAQRRTARFVCDFCRDWRCEWTRQSGRQCDAVWANRSKRSSHYCYYYWWCAAVNEYDIWFHITLLMLLLLQYYLPWEYFCLTLFICSHARAAHTWTHTRARADTNPSHVSQLKSIRGWCALVFVEQATRCHLRIKHFRWFCFLSEQLNFTWFCTCMYANKQFIACDLLCLRRRHIE